MGSGAERRSPPERRRSKRAIFGPFKAWKKFSNKYLVGGRCGLRPGGDIAITYRSMAMAMITVELLGAEEIVFDIGEYILVHLDSQIAVLAIRS